MARGGKVDFAELAAAVGEKSVVDREKGIDGVFRANLPVEELAANPENPRTEIGELDDLETLVERQLQPITVVSRSVWLTVYPEHEKSLGDARFVVVNGCRRLAAAREFGRPGLDAVIRDSLASDRASIVAAAITENLARRNLDPIEEAIALNVLIGAAGTAVAAARALGKTEGWVSQRRSLLNLSPELQDLVKKGRVRVRDAREVAKLPHDEQVAALQDRQGHGRSRADSLAENSPVADASGSGRDVTDNVDDLGGRQGEAGDDTSGSSSTPTDPVKTSEAVGRALRRLRADPSAVALALRNVWTAEDISRLVDQLS